MVIGLSARSPMTAATPREENSQSVGRSLIARDGGFLAAPQASERKLNVEGRG